MSQSAMNKDSLAKWLRAMVSAMPHGGKRKAAEMLGISPSGLSKILSNPERSFDEKTLRAVAWLTTSKAERYSIDEFPIIRTVQIDGLTIEARQLPDGGEFITWRANQP